MIIKFDGVSTTPVFVDPYTKTCFVTCDVDWPTDPSTIQLDMATVEFDFICDGNPHIIERNDIITTIETDSERFENLNIRIGSIGELGGILKLFIDNQNHLNSIQNS